MSPAKRSEAAGRDPQLHNPKGGTRCDDPRRRDARPRCPWGARAQAVNVGGGTPSSGGVACPERAALPAASEELVQNP